MPPAAFDASEGPGCRAPATDADPRRDMAHRPFRPASHKPGLSACPGRFASEHHHRAALRRIEGARAEEHRPDSGDGNCTTARAGRGMARAVLCRANQDTARGRVGRRLRMGPDPEGFALRGTKARCPRIGGIGLSVVRERGLVAGVGGRGCADADGNSERRSMKDGLLRVGVAGSAVTAQCVFLAMTGLAV